MENRNVYLGKPIHSGEVVLARECVEKDQECPIFIVLLYDPDIQKYVTGIYRNGEVLWKRTFYLDSFMEATQDYNERRRV